MRCAFRLRGEASVYHSFSEHFALHPVAASDTQLQTKLNITQNICHQPNRAAKTISVPQNLLAVGLMTLSG